MPVLPEEVAAKTFPRRWRGYARPQVEAFLREVADDYAAAINRIATTAEDRGRAESATEDLVARLAAVVESAQQTAEKTRADAHADADAIRARAEHTATQIISQAEQAAAALTRQAEAQRVSAQTDADTARERLTEADGRAQHLETTARERWEAVRAETERRWDELHTAERRLAERTQTAHTALNALRSKVALLDQVDHIEHQLAGLTTDSAPAGTGPAPTTVGNAEHNGAR